MAVPEPGNRGEADHYWNDQAVWNDIRNGAGNREGESVILAIGIAIGLVIGWFGAILTMWVGVSLRDVE